VIIKEAFTCLAKGDCSYSNWLNGTREIVGDIRCHHVEQVNSSTHYSAFRASPRSCKLWMLLKQRLKELSEASTSLFEKKRFFFFSVFHYLSFSIYFALRSSFSLPFTLLSFLSFVLNTRLVLIFTLYYNSGKSTEG